MRLKQHHPLRASSGPGLDDYLRAADEIEALSTPSALLKQAAVQRRRRTRLVERVHRLVPRVTFELLDEIACHHGLDADLDRRLERYARLDPEILRALGGDRFARSPIRVGSGEP
jgi:hypothetical protein